VTEPRRERKVVTVLFADLVGFTSRAEQLDPEDVEEILRPYHERLRHELERHGGTVEKFIGDAVMAVFGAPVAHEDDPERAVRAGLAIREWATEDGQLEVRIAVNTGEALVRLGARPAEGEGMVAGDVVNTAARLQAAAPVNGVLVGEVTYRATRDAIEYREAEAVTAKGKAEPVQVWEAVEARSRVGLEAAAPATPLVGRQRELDLLLGALARAREETSAQLVTLVGVPGIGKSRLVYELSQAIENQPDLISWRRGRSLPYGEGVTYWALSEMVKAQAGILETDAADATESKLGAAISELADGDVEAQWLEASLGPLVGLVEDGGAPRDDRFAAWRRFLEALAEHRPLVLVFEDLHWADDDLLDFVDYLVDWATGVPLLVVCVARPELLQRRPAWGGGKPNALTISLSPLSDAETARLIAALLERAVLPAETQAELLARAGGNPLFAEQFARMLRERPDATLVVPETVQGMIAARLDALTSEEKALLQDAAVMGGVFWAGALALEDERTDIEQRLHGLERKEFVRRQRRPSVEGELEYAFHHLLVRDVVYSQIPRAARAEKHHAAAEWIESLGRHEDHAEMLAHHYQAALEYARAAGRETRDLEERARFALREAGERAAALNAYHPALRYYRAALELWPHDDSDRPDLVFRAAEAEWLAAESGRDALAEASELLIRAGDRGRAAEAEVMMAGVVWHEGDREAQQAHLARAAELVADLPPSRSKALVLANLGRYQMLASENDAALALLDEALEMAASLGLDDIRAGALISRGTVRANLGDEGGLDDLEQSMELAERGRAPFEAGRAYTNFASILADLGDVERAIVYHDKGLENARRYGLARVVHWLVGEKSLDYYLTGSWDDSVAAAGEVIAVGESGARHYMETMCRILRALIRLARGQEAAAIDDASTAVEIARGGQDPQALWPALAVHARVFAECGFEGEAESTAAEVLVEWRGPLDLLAGVWFIHLAIALDALGKRDELLDAAPRARAATRWLDAAKAYAAKDFAGAAEILLAMPSLPEAALADLRAAEAAIAAGNRPEGDFHLQRALAFWRSVGATRYVREGEALLAESA
jgi:class 3 adenylate cyclase